MAANTRYAVSAGHTEGREERHRLAVRKYYIKNREAIRERRNAQERANPRQKDRTTTEERARAKLRYAVWSGKISKPPVCQNCGSGGKIHGHHSDYSKPLCVQWLCPPCHGLAHAKSILSQAREVK